MASRGALLITSTKRRIMDLADNNRRRWSQFTGDVPFTYSVFVKKLVDLQITRVPDEAKLVWPAFNVQGEEMQFREFVQFLQADTYFEPSALPRLDPLASSESTFHRCRKALIDFCLSIDYAVDGFITRKQLADFALSNSLVSNASELAPIMEKFDPSSSGKMNYFKLMDDICDRDSAPRAPETHARNSLDPTIFGEKPSSGHGPKSDGGRKDLDPSIFGAKPPPTVVREAPAATLDLTSARDCTDYNTEQSMSLIARVANSKFRSLRDCFGSWRTAGDRLSWEDIYRGMVTYAKVELKPEVLEAIAQEYGGDMTVGGFTRLVSDGARLNAPEPVREAPPPLTERDVLLNKIATGLKGKPWEPAIKASKNALDLARNLKRLGCDMKSDELRAMFEGLGMKRICDEIRQRQAPPKKRGG
jgi:hypothetical protein